MDALPQVITFTHENIINISKNVMKPSGWKCEWGEASASTAECKITLISWNAYFQHLLLHCKQVRKHKEPKKYICQLPRCNVPQDLANFLSSQELAIHVESSHMIRVPLVCPISGCNSIFSRAALLESHFISLHGSFIGKELSIKSPLLLPFWKPFIPGLHALPELPYNEITGSAIVGEAHSNWRRSTHDLLQQLQLPLNIPIPSVKKQRLLGHSPDHEDHSQETRTHFDDLPNRSDKSSGMWIGTLDFSCCVRQKGPYFTPSHPQCMYPPEDCIHQPPPHSIHYEVFAGRWDGPDEEEKEEEKEDRPVIAMDN